MLLCLAFLAAVAVIAWWHHAQDGQWSFRLFDAAWWQPGVSRSQPVLEAARRDAQRANDAVWGDHGLVDEVERWWRARRAPAPTPAPATAERRRLEGFLADADRAFESGLHAYHEAGADSSARTRATLESARSSLLAAQDLLARTIPAYRACADHDADRLAEAEAEAAFDERLLAAVTKRLGLPPPP